MKEANRTLLAFMALIGCAEEFPVTLGCGPADDSAKAGGQEGSRGVSRRTFAETGGEANVWCGGWVFIRNPDDMSGDGGRGYSSIGCETGGGSIGDGGGASAFTLCLRKDLTGLAFQTVCPEAPQKLFYMRAEGGGGGSLDADGDKVGPWETFQLIPQVGKGKFSFMTSDGHYLSEGNPISADSWPADRHTLKASASQTFILDGVAGLDDPRLCGRPAVDPAQFDALFKGMPVSSHFNRVGDEPDWRMEIKVSEDDGLEVKDVRLGQRYMTESMSLPYVKLTFKGEQDPQKAIRCEMTHRDDAPLCSNTCCARLVDLRGPDQSRTDKFWVEATYEINFGKNALEQASPIGCVFVAQRYEFQSESFSGNCEPSGKLRCSRFLPIVRYQLINPLQGLPNFRIWVPQRLRHRPSPDNRPGSQSASVLLHDVDFPGINFTQSGLTWPLRGNPLPRETVETVVVNGQSSWVGPVQLLGFNDVLEGYTSTTVDNFHLSQHSGPVDRPKFVDINPPFLFVPGCADCVHTHWRWSAFVPGMFGGGKPLIPPGSQQSITIGVIKYHDGEQNPPDFRLLAQPYEQTYAPTGEDRCPSNAKTCETLDVQPPVLWYEGSSSARQDTFFQHGSFFSAQGVSFVPPPPHVPKPLSKLHAVPSTGNGER